MLLFRLTFSFPQVLAPSFRRFLFSYSTLSLSEHSFPSPPCPTVAESFAAVMSQDTSLFYTGWSHRLRFVGQA